MACTVVSVVLVLLTVLAKGNGASQMRHKGSANSTSTRETIHSSSASVANTSEHTGFQFKQMPGLGGVSNHLAPETKANSNKIMSEVPTAISASQAFTSNSKHFPPTNISKPFPPTNISKPSPPTNISKPSPPTNISKPSPPTNISKQSTQSNIFASPSSSDIYAHTSILSISTPKSVLSSSTPTSNLNTLMKNISKSWTPTSNSNTSTSTNHLNNMLTSFGKQTNDTIQKTIKPTGFFNQSNTANNTNRENEPYIEQNESGEPPDTLMTSTVKLESVTVPNQILQTSTQYAVSPTILNKEKISTDGINTEVGQSSVERIYSENEATTTTVTSILTAGETSVSTGTNTEGTPLSEKVESPASVMSVTGSNLTTTQVAEESGLENKTNTIVEPTNNNTLDTTHSIPETPAQIVQSLHQKLNEDRISQFGRIFSLNKTTKKSHDESIEDGKPQQQLITDKQNVNVLSPTIGEQRILPSTSLIGEYSEPEGLGPHNYTWKSVQDSIFEMTSKTNVTTFEANQIFSSKNLSSLAYQGEITTPINQDHTTWKTTNVTDETTLQPEMTSSQYREIMLNHDSTTTTEDSTTGATYRPDVVTSTKIPEYTSKKIEETETSRFDSELHLTEQPNVGSSNHDLTTLDSLGSSNNEIKPQSEVVNTSTQPSPLEVEFLKNSQPGKIYSQHDQTKKGTQTNQDLTKNTIREPHSNTSEETTSQADIKSTRTGEILSDNVTYLVDQGDTTTVISQDYTTIEAEISNETSLPLQDMSSTHAMTTTVESEETTPNTQDRKSLQVLRASTDETASIQKVENNNVQIVTSSPVESEKPNDNPALSSLKFVLDDVSRTSTKSSQNDTSSLTSTYPEIPELTQPNQHVFLNEVSDEKPPFQCVATVPRLNLNLEKMLGVWYPAKLSTTTSKLWGQSFKNQYNIGNNDCLLMEYVLPPNGNELEILNVFLRIGDDLTQVDALFVGDDKHPKESKWAISWPNGEDTLTSVVAAGVIGKERNRYTWLLTVDCDLNGIVEPDWAVMARIPEGISNSTLTTILAIVEGLKGLTVENAITFQSDDCHK